MVVAGGEAGQGHIGVKWKTNDTSGPGRPTQHPSAHRLKQAQMKELPTLALCKISSRFDIGAQGTMGVLREGWPWNFMIPLQGCITGSEPRAISLPTLGASCSDSCKHSGSAFYHHLSCRTQLCYRLPLQIKPIKTTPNLHIFLNDWEENLLLLLSLK